MILSFHPIYEADVNRLCAGRQPDENDLAAIRKADAVILPQGCGEALYRMARSSCPNVFPDYDLRFQFPGKTGQARLFQRWNAPHPRTWIFENAKEFSHAGHSALDAGFPLVLKLDWGGEGDTVFLVENALDLENVLLRVKAYERTGQSGFILQTFIPGAHRSLRVVVVGGEFKAYWRIQSNPMAFGTSVGKGARIDPESDPALRERGLSVVREFCRQTKINLAGFDVLFYENTKSGTDPHPLLLEINYFFGRNGLGGSDSYYLLLQSQIDRWLETKGLPNDQERGGKA